LVIGGSKEDKKRGIRDVYEEEMGEIVGSKDDRVNKLEEQVDLISKMV
jgi:hypothetical protein